MLHFLAQMMYVIGAVMLVPALLAPLLGEIHAVPAFLLPSIVCFLLGLLMKRRAAPEREITLGETMALIAAVWIIFAAFASIPFVTIAKLSPVDAYFESMSGLTATGLTMIPTDPVADHIVISEVGMLDEFGSGYVEIYNPTEKRFDLSGINLWIVGENGDRTLQPLAVPFIDGYSYLLLANTDNVRGESPDGSLSSQIPASGAVILEMRGRRLDALGWGEMHEAGEGGGIPHRLVPGSSLERKPRTDCSPACVRESKLGNAVDTDNNSRDFVFHENYQSPLSSSSPRREPLRSVDRMERTILFWRSFTQWVGGLGVVVLFLAAAVSFGRAHRKMYFAEAHPILIMPSIRDTARVLWKIYAILTIAGVVILYLTSWPNSSLFDAVNHAMTGIATGGFSVRGSSFSAYGLATRLSVLLIMVWGATNFTVHEKVLRGRLNLREFFNNMEVRFMLLLIAVFALILLPSVGPVDALFQTTSALTGTGFSTADIAKWGDGPKAALVVLMMIGGSYGSTSSAIKLIRIIILAKTVHWTLKKGFLPERAVVPMKLGGHTYTEREIMEVLMYTFIYVILMFVGAGILMALGYPPMNSIFESASAQGNVGLTAGVTSAGMPLAGKISLTIQMLVGRLEILPVLALLNYAVSKVRERLRPF